MPLQDRHSLLKRGQALFHVGRSIPTEHGLTRKEARQLVEARPRFLTECIEFPSVVREFLPELAEET